MDRADTLVFTNKHMPDHLHSRLSSLEPGPGDSSLDLTLPTSSSDKWIEQGAAQLVKQNTDNDSGRVTTTVVRRTVKDFQWGKSIGEGSYSTVVLATEKETSKKYAVKVLDKRHIIKEKKVKYVNIEKNTLNRLGERDGIIHLFYTFQDEGNLYFVLDYASNGELLSLIKKTGTLNEECTKYYAAQIVDAVEYLHNNGVIHRDLKPENILIDPKMRVQITDFGTAVLLEKEEGAYPLDTQAKSFVGTAEYVSPELLNDKACGKPCDIWAIGCIIYQMISGKPPFKAPNEYLTFQKVCRLQYAFTPGFPSILRDLVKRILVLDPKERATLVSIKAHLFFHDVDWQDHKSIWNTDPPTLVPYKVSAMAMLPFAEAARRISTSDSELSVRRPVSQPSKSSPNLSEKAVPPKGRRTVSSPKPATDLIPGTNISRPQGIRTLTEKRQVKGPEKKQTEKRFDKIQKEVQTENKHSKTGAKYDHRKQEKQVQVPPMTSVDLQWVQWLKHSDERIMRVGHVIVSVKSTDAFEKEYKGLLADSPLDYASRPGSSSSASLLSQVANGNHPGLRSKGSMSLPHVSEDQGIVVSENDNKDEQEEERKGLGIFKKMFAVGSVTNSRTLVITSFGRALTFSEDEAKQLRTEVDLTNSNVRFKEVVGRSRSPKGIFAIETHRITFVFEVEKPEVPQWTTTLAQSRLLERDRLERLAYEDDKPGYAGTRTRGEAAAAAAMLATSPKEKPMKETSPQLGRSSFEGERTLPKLVTQMNSRFLARSHRR